MRQSRFTGDPTSKERLKARLSPQASLRQGLLERVRGRLAQDPHSNFKSFDPVAEPIHLRVEGNLEAEVAAIVRIRAETGKERPLEGKKFAVVVEALFIPEEQHAYQRIIEELGGKVDFVSNLWGQPSLNFTSHVEGDWNSLKTAQTLTVSKDIDKDVLPNLKDYAGVIFSANYVTKRLNFAPGAAGVHAIEGPGIDATLEAARLNKAVLRAEQETPQARLVNAVMQDKGLAKAFNCHSIWALMTHPEYAKGLTMAHNPVMLPEAQALGINFAPTRPGQDIHTNTHVDRSAYGPVVSSSAGVGGGTEALIGALTKTVLETTRSGKHHKPYPLARMLKKREAKLEKEATASGLSGAPAAPTSLASEASPPTVAKFTKFDAPVTSKPQRETHASLGSLRKQEMLERLFSRLERKPYVAVKSFAPVSEPIQLRVEGNLEAEVAAIARIRQTTGKERPLEGKKFAVVVEALFIPEEQHAYQRIIEELGGKVDFVSNLWGQPSLNFTSHVEGDWNSLKTAQTLTVSKDIDRDVLPNLKEYSGVIFSANYVTKRLNFAPGAGGIHAIEGPGIDAATEASRLNSAARAAEQDTPQARLVKAVMEDAQLAKAFNCHSIWALMTHPEYAKGLTMAHNPVMLPEAQTLGINWAPIRPGQDIHTNTHVDRSAFGPVVSSSAGVGGGTEALIEALTSTVLEVAPGGAVPGDVATPSQEDYVRAKFHKPKRSPRLEKKLAAKATEQGSTDPASRKIPS